jgi:hypothetical protein
MRLSCVIRHWYFGISDFIVLVYFFFLKFGMALDTHS